MRYCRVLVIVIIFVVVSLIFTYKFFVNSIPKTITIATGRTTGAYYDFAQKYQERLQKDNIQVNIKQTAGSVQSLDLLSRGEVDVAFVQGGTAKDYKDKNLLSLSSVFYEPLWVFYRDELKIDFLNDLKGKRVSIGEEGSGTKALFEILFKENGIDSDTLLSYENDIALEKLKNKELDAFCVVVSPESSLIKNALATKGIKLMSFTRDLAYKDKYDYIDNVNLSQGVIDLSKNIPLNNVKLLATTASLVINEELNHNLQRLIIKNIKPIHKNGGIFEPKDFFPSPSYVELPISEHTKSYLENGETWTETYLPFWLSSLIEALLVFILPMIPIIIIFVKVVLPSYSLYFKHKIYLWEEQICTLEHSLDNRNRKNKELLIKDIEELKKTIHRSCIIYFFYTHLYYMLILRLNNLIKRLNNEETKIKIDSLSHLDIENS